MQTIQAATAKRAGAGITVTGKNEAGQDVKLADVKRIKITKDGGIAITKDEVQVRLRA
jgi:hypothetical protein